MKNILYVNFKTRQVVESRNETVNSLQEIKETFKDRETVFERYDLVVTQLTNRYGLNQPKGGVIVKSATYKHGDIVSLETYGRGDCHNSLHKHEVKTKLQKTGNWNRPMPFPVDLKVIDKVLLKNKNKTLVMGYASDPFQWIDQKYKNTHSTLQLANKYNIKLKIETMSDLCAHDDYIDLLIDGDHEIVMHMGIEGFTDTQERRLSPGAPSLNRRHAAVSKLLSVGVKVTTKVVSHEDMIKYYPTKELNMIGISKKTYSLEELFPTLDYKSKSEVK
jgi:hypothetical protein